MRGGKRAADVRASLHNAVEVVALDRASFNNLLSESETIRLELDRVIAQRDAQNREFEAAGSAA